MATRPVATGIPSPARSGTVCQPSVAATTAATGHGATADRGRTSRHCPTGSGATTGPTGQLRGATSYRPVKSGETLMGIASQVRPSTTIKLPEMMAILVAGNSEAFVNGNPNVLRAGSVLKVPTRRRWVCRAYPHATRSECGCGDTHRICPNPTATTDRTATGRATTGRAATGRADRTTGGRLATGAGSAACHDTAAARGASTVTGAGRTVAGDHSSSQYPSNGGRDVTSAGRRHVRGETSRAAGTPPPVVQPEPALVRPPPVAKPPVAQPEESEFSWLANPVVWIALAMIVLAVAAVVLLPLLRRPAKPKQPPVEPERSPSRSPPGGIFRADHSHPDPRISFRSAKARRRQFGGPAGPGRDWDHARNAQTRRTQTAATPPKPIDELLKDIDFGLGMRRAERRCLGAEAGNTALAGYRASHGFGNPHRHQSIPVGGTGVGQGACSIPPGRPHLPSELRLDNLDFDFGDLGFGKHRAVETDLPPLELRPTESGATVNPAAGTRRVRSGE